MSFIYNQIVRLLKIQLFVYTVVGGIVTVIDWALFAICLHLLHFHYLTSITISFVVAASVHFAANKIFTFQCTSKEIATQIVIFLAVSIPSLFTSMLVLSTLIKFFTIDEVYLRMITTFIMLFPNYIIHKYITFNKKLFSTADMHT